MNELAQATAAETEADPIVDELVDEFARKLQSGAPVDAEEFAKQHPDQADQLLLILPALQMLTDLGCTAAVRGPSSHADPTETGTLGDFRILREVGRGGMGVVYEAEQISLGRRVALKVLPYAATMDAKQLQRFKNEARAAAGLKHEHIVQVFGVGCERGVHFYSMEFIDGQTLAQLIAGMALAGREERAPAPDRTAAFVPTSSQPSVPANGPGTSTPEQDRAKPSSADTAPVAGLSTERSGAKGRSFYHSAAGLMAQAADALEQAHELGLVHRDVKPGNLMVDTAGKLWVTDFGLARFGPDAGLTLSGDLLGTLRYMAPEQALSHHGLVDHRADIYALGATLYELLTGRPVVAAAERGEILRQIAFEEATRPRKLDKTIPIELETITMKCLTKNPAERYATASALSDDLRRFLADQPIRARQAGPVDRVRRWGRRHPALAGVYGLLVLVLVLAVSGGAAVWQWQIAEEARDIAEGARGIAEAARVQAVAALEGQQQAQAGEAEARRQRDEVKALANQLRRTLYTSNVNLAWRAREAGDIDRAIALLEQVRAKPGDFDLRGFEWHYLYRLCHPEIFTLRGHARQVYSVAFSPDGKRMASASADKTVKIWDAETGQELLAIVEKGPIHSVAFSPDGKRLAGGGILIEQGKPLGKLPAFNVKVWDIQTGQELLTIKGAWRVVFSPDGRCLAGDGKVWDAQTGAELLSLKDTSGKLAYSPDGKRLAGNSADKAVKVWDAQTGQELLTLNGHNGGVNNVAFSPDRKRLASASADRTVRVWDAQTGVELLIIKGGGNGVAFSPDGKHLASASGVEQTVNVWDARTGEEFLTLKGHTGPVWNVAFSPDGKRLASPSADNTVKVWDAQTGQKPLALQGGNPSVVRIAFSPDGKPLVAGAGNPAAAGPRMLKVWDAETGQEISSLKGHDSGVIGLSFSPDAKRLASVSSPSFNKGEVKVWDVRTGQELFTLNGTGTVWGVAFSADGKRMASTSMDGTVKVWDAPTGREILTLIGHAGGVASVAFSPDGKYLASGSGRWETQSDPSKGGDVKVWDVQSGQCIFTLKGHTMVVFGLAFSPDGKRLVSASMDKALKVWDAETGQELLSLKGHTGSVNRVAFSPDGKRLASASADKTIKVWDAQTGQELLTLKGRIGFFNNDVAFSPNGRWLVSASEDGRVTILDATPLPEKR